MSKIALLLISLLLVTATVTAQTIVKGEVSGRWWKDRSPYIIDGDVIIPGGNELKIDPGVTVRYKPRQDVSTIEVRGSLIVAGSPNDSVLFTSNALRPTTKDWGSIIVIGGEVSIQYTNFHYYRPAVVFYGGLSADITHSRFFRADLTKGGMPDSDTTDFIIGGSMPDQLIVHNSVLDGNNRTRDGISVKTDLKGHLNLNSLHIWNFLTNGIYAYYTGNNVDPLRRSVSITNLLINRATTGMVVIGGTISEYQISGNHITDCDDGAQLKEIRSSKPFVSYNDIYDILNTGLLLAINTPTQDTFTVRNNIVHHCSIGIQFTHNMHEDSILTTFFEFNTIAYCYSPLLPGGIYRQDVFRLRNNIFSDCSRGVILGLYPPASAYNIFWNHRETQGWFTWTVMTENDIYGDPLFVSEYDLHLRPNSIAIDRADPEVAVGDEPEPNGGRANIGGYGTTAEATITTEEPLGSIPTMIPRNVSFTLSRLNLLKKDQLKTTVSFGNYGDVALKILSYTLSDTTNFTLTHFQPVDLPPLARTKNCSLFFQPKVAKIFAETLFVHTSAGDIFLPITGESTGQPIISGKLPQGTTIWTKENSPYIIAGKVSNTDTDTLIIEPGVTVLMKDSSANMSGYNLTAKGTKENPITIKSLGTNNNKSSFGFNGVNTVSQTKCSNINLLWFSDVRDDSTKATHITGIIKDKHHNPFENSITLHHARGGMMRGKRITTVNGQGGFQITGAHRQDYLHLSNLFADHCVVGQKVYITADEDMMLPSEQLLMNSISTSNDIGIQYLFARNGNSIDSAIQRNVCIWNNKEEGWVGTYGSPKIKPLRFENVLRADPMFMYSPSYLYNLHKDSPCIDTGNPEGEWDPDGSPPDFGANPYDHNNIPAELNRIFPDVDQDCEIGDNIQFWALAQDPEEWGLDYLWMIGDSTFWGESKLSWKFAESGEYLVAVQAYDGFNFSATVDWLVRVAPLGGEPLAESPHQFAITALYPNPFNDVTTLRYTLPGAGTVDLTVFDIQGRTLLYNRDIRTMGGTVIRVLDFSRYPAGLYFVRMQYGGVVEYRKLVHLR